MKKAIIGFVCGCLFATVSSAYADEGLQKIEAYLRPSLPVTLDGKSVNLESPPVVYDGSTYLKLRDVAKLTGVQVNWNDATQTVELTSGGSPKMDTTSTAQETTFNGLHAIIVNGETYFSLFDYSRKFDPYQWGYDKDTNTVFLAETVKNTTTIKRKLVELNKDDPTAIQIYKGSTHVNIKYYQEY